MENVISEISARFQNVQVDAVSAQNTRLIHENATLKAELERITTEQRTSKSFTLEHHLQLHKLEEERDKLRDALNSLKTRYNKLHAAYSVKVRRCIALEEVFKKQKTLPGAVPKGAFKALRPLGEIKSAPDAYKEERSIDHRMQKLQAQLDEAYDIIDELEFELESIDYLEEENNHLRNELSELKEASRYEENSRVSTLDDGVNDGNGRGELLDGAAASSTSVYDVATIMSPKLIKTAELETHCLQRELLRSRLQQSNWRKKRVDEPVE